MRLFIANGTRCLGGVEHLENTLYSVGSGSERGLNQSCIVVVLVVIHYLTVLVPDCR